MVSDDDVSSDEAARPTQFRSGPSQVSGQSGGSAASGSKLKLKKRKTPTPARDTDAVPSSQRASSWCHVSLITSPLLWLYVCFGTVVVTHAQVHRTPPDDESEELPPSSQRAVVKKKRSVKREKNEEVVISDGEDLEGQSFFVSFLVWL